MPAPNDVPLIDRREFAWKFLQLAAALAVPTRVSGEPVRGAFDVIVRTRTRGADGTAHEMVSHGRYADEWERRAGEWRISRRRYLHSLDEAWTARTTLFPPGGSRDGDDPSYDVAPAP